MLSSPLRRLVCRSPYAWYGWQLGNGNATNFRENELGAQPAGWTKRWATTPTWNVTAQDVLPGARGPVVAPGASDVAGLGLDAVGTSVTDFDAVCAAYPSSTGSAGSLAGRGQTGATNGYFFGFRANGTEIYLTKPGVADILAVSFPYSANTLYFLRLRIQGTNVKCKAWLASATEPSSWNIDVTDATYANGFCGLGAFGNGGNIHFGWYAIHIGSGSAPLPNG